jgi:hypothetical protein
MGEVVKFKKPKPGEKFKGRSLCASGFHKWEAVLSNPFDVDKGRLITRYACKRCGATKTEAK